MEIHTDDNGNLHRSDGPAVITPDGSKFWWTNGKLHRMNGPAVVDTVNNKNLWYFNGYPVTDEVTAWAKERNLNLNDLSIDDINAMAFELQHLLKHDD